ncbi:MAG: tRNA (N6-threonylcarbamoyladenosine(37)-N6)-methyltransferase TrmO [Bacteroidales bacterium]|nr:tRNA (N6-threonylcarbamoyladenosine(37)-N6)-methyltransferase TrmO [Bacteroidales bacterium]
MEIKPIAYFRSPFPEKFGIPRQAGLAPALRGRIVFEPEYRSADALRGLEGFDYLWLIWEFSSRKTPERSEAVESPELAATGSYFQATVRPPRLGGNKRVGVFASRSPFRPNPLGLSSVRIESIDYDAKSPEGKSIGPVINVLGADLMDGTPIYDIKPYIEYADSHPGVRSGFVNTTSWEPLEVIFPESARNTGVDLDALREVLSIDPRPRYQDDPGKEYGMSFGGRQVRFRVEGKTLTVISIE